jgi:hypothetical protein
MPEIVHQRNGAYDFLMASRERSLDDEDYFGLLKNGESTDRTSHDRGQYYARSSFARFKNSKYYKSTRILNGTSVVFNFAVAIIVLLYTILGYILKLKNPVPGEEKINLLSFILLLALSIILFTVAFIYLKEFIETNIKQNKKK